MYKKHVQETCTRNLHVCHSDLQQNFFCASFLHEIEHVLFDVLAQETCVKNLMQVFCTNLLYKFLARLPPALVKFVYKIWYSPSLLFVTHKAPKHHLYIPKSTTWSLTWLLP